MFFPKKIMSLWDWLSKLLFGESSSGRLHVPGLPGVCAYCSARLPTPDAQICHACGYDWRDPFNVVRLSGYIGRPQPQAPQRPPPAPPTPQQTFQPARQPVPQRPPPPKRENKTLAGLDASQFIGMTSSEIKKDLKASGGVRMGGAGFGRRDMVPPA